MSSQRLRLLNRSRICLEPLTFIEHGETALCPHGRRRHVRDRGRLLFSMTRNCISLSGALPKSMMCTCTPCNNSPLPTRVERFQVHRSEDNPGTPRLFRLLAKFLRFHPWSGKHLERNRITYSDRHIAQLAQNSADRDRKMRNVDVGCAGMKEPIAVRSVCSPFCASSLSFLQPAVCIAFPSFSIFSPFSRKASSPQVSP